MSKKKFLKQITVAVTLVLALVFALTACGSSNSASSASGTSGTSLTWNYDSSSKTLTVSGNGAMTAFTSSDAVEWKSVRTSAEKVVVENGVTNISDYAFYYFSALKSVSLPNTVTTIGKCSFAYCSSLEGITIPTVVSSIGESAFEGCSSIKAIFIPASVASIGARAFAYCPALTEAVIVGNITELPSLSFKNCTALSKLVFNNAITADKIAADAFEGCSVSFSNATFTESDTAAATLTIKYLYADGTQAAEPIVSSDLAYGSYYVHNSPAIDGYTADRLTVSGYVYGTDVEEIVTYTANAPADTQSLDTTDQSEPEKPVSNTSTIVAIVVLAVVLIGIGVAAFFIIRSDKKNAQARGKNNNRTAQNGKSSGKKKK